MSLDVYWTLMKDNRENSNDKYQTSVFHILHDRVNVSSVVGIQFARTVNGDFLFNIYLKK